MIVGSDDDETHDVLRSENPVLPPLIASFNDSIMCALRDAIHSLRCMNVVEEGITLPTIVFIGDQSSGKSSVIESLTGISLPRGQGICTRVPLILKLQHHSEVSELHLEYQGKYVPVIETSLLETINLAMDKIAGIDNAISDVPLTLVVKKNSVPDLTIVDLPGIPIHEKPEDIYKKISDIIVEHIKPKERLIVNVMSATADFLTCKSMRMSKKFDKRGKRTLHVFTKADKSLDDMVTIVTTNMGPDYVCVRNRLGDETYEEARNKEVNLFNTHHLLSKIDKSIVGIHALAQKLVLIMLTSISKWLWETVMKIDEDLNMCLLEQTKLQQHFTSISEAMPAFLKIIKMSKKSFSKIAISCEFDEFPDEPQMHCYSRVVEMINEFSQNLKKNVQVKEKEKFLIDEIPQLEESKGFEQVFNLLFQRKITSLTAITDSFVSIVWDYIEVVIVNVLVLHAQNYPQLLLSLKKAAKVFIAKTKYSFKGKVLKFLDMNKMEGYTRDPRVISSWNKLKESRGVLKGIQGYDHETDYFNYVRVCVGHLSSCPERILNEAFDIKTKIVACLEVVLQNVIDLVELDLRFMVGKIVENEMETEMVEELKSDDGNRYKSMLKESPLMTTKRWKLKNRIELLGELKKVVKNAMDEISFHGY